MCGVVSYLVIEADRHPVDINNDGIRNGNTWTQCNEVMKRNKVSTNCHSSSNNIASLTFIRDLLASALT